MSTLRHYLAPSLAEAAARIKSELGSDAIILQTRTVRRGRLWGLLGPPMVEVTVAEPAPAAAAAAPPLRRPETGQLLATEAVRREMEAIRSMVGELQQSQSRRRLPPAARDLLAALRRQGVTEEIALRLLGKPEATEPAALRQRVGRQVLQHLGRPEPLRVRHGEGRVAALVGPTGAGKTTTLAKLAAHFALQGRLRVGVICADTRRIGAEAQLRTYCELIGVPLLVADEPEEIAAARERLAGCDLILADTAGRGPRDPAQLAALQAQLAALAPREVYLVLSLTTGAGEAQAAAAAFAPLGCTHLLGTKLDECSAPGALLNLRAACRLSLSYVGTGQQVPGNLHLLDPAAYCQDLLGALPC